MKRLKFYWNSTEEELKVLQRLARLTGHASIRDLFGTCVNAGLEALQKGLNQELDKMKSSSQVASENIQPAQETLPDEANVQPPT